MNYAKGQRLQVFDSNSNRFLLAEADTRGVL